MEPSGNRRGRKVSVTEQVIERRSPEEWQTELLRVTAFLRPGVQIKEPIWWSEVVGQQPEARMSRPPMGAYQDEGVHEGRKLILQVQPSRVDWIFTPNEGENQPLTLGSVPESLLLTVPVLSVSSVAME